MDIDTQYDKIYRYCYYKVRDRHTAEDITQEVFLRFLDSGYREQGKLLQYLYTIARNLCVDYYRGKDTVARMLTDDLSEVSGDSEFENTIEIRADIWRVLNTLSEEDREILLLKYANEEKDAVICRVYGISRFTLYRRLRRLRKELKTGLPDYP